MSDRRTGESASVVPQAVRTMKQIAVMLPEAAVLRTTISLLIVGLGFAAIAASALAHHSSAAYEPVKLVTIEGVVHSVKWRNPHIFIEVAVPAGDGQTEIWSVEGSGTASTVASGVTADLLKVGNKVKVIAHPARDRSSRQALLLGLEVNGKYYARGGGTNIRDEGR